MFAEIIEVSDMASGLSDRRKGFARRTDMAREGQITDLAIPRKDRLTRYVRGLDANGCKSKCWVHLVAHVVA